MSEWVMILLEAEEAWANSATIQSLSARDLGVKDYCRTRDIYKARYILTKYGHDYFLRFVERCPHIEESLPCGQGEQNCNMFCKFYKGGCIYATEQLD